MVQYFLKQLQESNAIADLDDPGNIEQLRDTIQRKLYLKKTYISFYQDLLRRIEDRPSEGEVVELGSGAGFLKSMAPDVITSDTLPYDGVDRVFSALEMPFGDRTISAFVLIDVLHHIKDSRRFFQEVLRCLKPGGKLVMIEPANTTFSSLIYRYLHHEPYDPRGGWGFEEGGPLSGANLAIPWIIFDRDRAIFEQDFSSFQICSLTPHTPLRYLLSGGLSMRQLLPDSFYPIVYGVEKLLTPINGLIGMFITIELRKQLDASH